jgi:SAM-dependent methyltransferase
LVQEKNGWPVVRCDVCGLVFVGRELAPDELIALYDEDYYEDPAEEGYASYAAAEARKRRHDLSLLVELEELVAPGNLLEIGCAYGFFLDEARARGWTVRGIEPSMHAAGEASRRLGIPIPTAAFTDLPVEPSSQDAIVMWDVIEHLPDPRATVEAAVHWLRPGGVLALSTGNIRSAAARLHGADWSLMTPPWHQFYFSRKTIRRLLSSAGLIVEHIDGDGSLGVDRASPAPRITGRLAAVLESRLVTTIARRLHAGSIMFVFARMDRQ